MANHTIGSTSDGDYTEWYSEEDDSDYPLYYDATVALRQYTMQADAYGDIEFYFYRAFRTYDAEDGWPVVYSDKNGKPFQLLVNLSKQRVGLNSGELGNWGHCTLHLTRDLKANEKVWIGIWSIFYTSSFNLLEKSRYSNSDYNWTYSLGTYRDDLEDPPPATAPSEWYKDDWQPVAIMPHYFVYSDVCPYHDYALTLHDTIGMTGVFRRKFMGYKKVITAGLHVAGNAMPRGMKKAYPNDVAILTAHTLLKKGFGLKVATILQAASGFMWKRRLKKTIAASIDGSDSLGTWRAILKKPSSTVDADEDLETWRDLLRKKVTQAGVIVAAGAEKTMNRFASERLKLKAKVTPERILMRLVDTFVTFWERVTRQRISTRLEAEFHSPVTAELILKSHIQEDDT